MGHPPEEFSNEHFVLIVVYTIISILILVSNIFIILVIITTKRLHCSPGILMATLAVADSMVGLSTLIPIFSYAHTQIATLPPIVCDCSAYINAVSMTLSLYILAILSIDKCIAVYKPLHYALLMTNTRCCVTIAIVLCLSLAIWILPIGGVGNFKYSQEELVCYFDVKRNPYQWFSYTIILFLPTWTIFTFSYVCIWKTLKKSQAQMAAMQLPSQSQGNKKAVKTLLLIISAFNIAWMPFVVEHLVKGFGGSVPEWVEIVSYVLALSNSFWNSIILVMTNKVFRKGTIRLLRVYCKCPMKCLASQVESVDSVNAVTLEQEHSITGQVTAFHM